MRWIICIMTYCVFTLSFAQAKRLPEFVQHKLDSAEKRIEKSLMYYRLWDSKKDGNMTLPHYLGGDIFSDDETRLINSLELNLSIGIVYDEEMRNRIAQLVRNEYDEWELDSLVNRQIGYNLSSYEYDAMEMCKFDTMQIFRKTLDSFYLDKRERTPYSKNMYKYDVFKLLQFDTTNIYKQVRHKVVEREREN